MRKGVKARRVEKGEGRKEERPEKVEQEDREGKKRG